MGENGSLDFITEIQALVSDKLQVVSYKWLSRNLSVSSNKAKRLLREFVDKDESGLKVIYALSGWSKAIPQTYTIKLVSSSKLEVVKSEFEDAFSVEIYSVQASIPKDPAALWSAEFVQAEELFDQPPTVENCLRDNRFSAVSNCFVKHTAIGKPVGVAPPEYKNVLESTVPAKASSTIQSPAAPQPQGQAPVERPSSVVKMDIKKEPDVQESHAHGNKHHTDKERITVVQGNKKKAQSDKGSTGNGGSLANLWGRASAKSKPICSAIETTKDDPEPILCAEAQICAREAAENFSSDDDVRDFSFKRDSNGGSSRKRRVVFDFSDNEDEDEIVVSLSSPDPPKSRSVTDFKSKPETLVLDKKDLSFEEPKGAKVDNKKEKSHSVTASKYKPESLVLDKKDLSFKESKGNKLDDKEDRRTPSDNGLPVKEDSEGAGKSKSGIHSQLPEDSNGKIKNKETDTGATLTKRRKVLKTRIDDRGREVTEVVWEGDNEETSHADKIANTNSTENRPPPAPKTPAVQTAAPSNSVAKAGNKKTAKGGVKDAKQGNILSFFKKA